MEQETKKSESSKQYPEGHFIRKWMVIGIVVFSGFGIPVSIATGNYAFIGIGPAIGVSIGLSIGSSVEAKHKKEGRIRLLTEEEKKKQKLLIILGILSLVVGILFFLLCV